MLELSVYVPREEGTHLLCLWVIEGFRELGRGVDFRGKREACPTDFV